MESRAEFVRLAGAEGASVSALCRRFGISRQAGYKWLARHRAGEGLSDRARRPAPHPRQRVAALERAVTALRGQHPSRGCLCSPTPLTVWPTRLGVRVSHSRPYHPQTNGKDERCHRTLKRDVLHGRHDPHLSACQAAFDGFRHVYNAERPHEAPALATPVTRCRASPRDCPETLPETLPTLLYDPIDTLRRVQQGGWISVRGHPIRFPSAFTGQPLAVTPTRQDGGWDIIFAAQTVARVNLRGQTATHQPGTHLSKQM